MSLRVYGKSEQSIYKSDGQDESRKAPDTPISKIAKLVPAEALGLHGAASGMIMTMGPSGETGAGGRAIWFIGLACVCLTLTVLVRYLATSEQRTKPAQWGAISISAGAYILWLWALPSEPGIISGGIPAAIVALVVSTFAAVLYPGDKTEP